MRRDRGLTVETSPFKENSGSSYLLDSVTNASKGTRRRLLGGGVGGKTPTTFEGRMQRDLGQFAEPLRRLSFIDKELLEVDNEGDTALAAVSRTTRMAHILRRSLGPMFTVHMTCVMSRGVRLWDMEHVLTELQGSSEKALPVWNWWSGLLSKSYARLNSR